MTDDPTAVALNALSEQVGRLTQVVLTIAKQQGNRISREDLAARMGVNRSTILRRLKTDRNFPRPGPDGKWLLSEVVRWELSTNASAAPEKQAA